MKILPRNTLSRHNLVPKETTKVKTESYSAIKPQRKGNFELMHRQWL